MDIFSVKQNLLWAPSSEKVPYGRAHPSFGMTFQKKKKIEILFSPKNLKKCKKLVTTTQVTRDLFCITHIMLLFPDVIVALVLRDDIARGDVISADLIHAETELVVQTLTLDQTVTAQR